MKEMIIKIGKAFLWFVGALGALFIVMFIMTMGDYKVPKTVSDDPTIPHIEINGVVFHAESFGDPANPVVVVVHGGPGWDYRSLLPLKDLADQYHVVFYDQRGAGLSPRVDPATLTLETTLQDLDAIVDYYGKGKKVNLIGHSWGAMLVSGYVGKHPEKVRRVILAEPGFLTTEMLKESGVKFGPRWEVGYLWYATKEWLRSLHINGPDADAAADYFLGRVAPPANVEYYCNDMLPEVALLNWRAGSQAMQNVLQSGMDSQGNLHINLIEGVERFQEPVLFLASDCNRLIGKEHQRKQMKFFQKTELVVIKGSGHMMFAEKPAESIKAVREYLNRQ